MGRRSVRIAPFSIVSAVSLVCIFLLAACHKGEFSVSQTIVQPFIELSEPAFVAGLDSDSIVDPTNDTASSWSMGLSLYVFASVPSGDGLQMVVSSPEGTLSWTFEPSAIVYDGVKYYGSSNIFMPRGVLLPTGSWSLQLLYKDGRTIDLPFEVSYRDVQGAIERGVGEGLPFFDTASNLTVVRSIGE